VPGSKVTKQSRGIFPPAAPEGQSVERKPQGQGNGRQGISGPRVHRPRPNRDIPQIPAGRPESSFRAFRATTNGAPCGQRRSKPPVDCAGNFSRPYPRSPVFPVSVAQHALSNPAAPARSSRAEPFEASSLSTRPPDLARRLPMGATDPSGSRARVLQAPVTPQTQTFPRVSPYRAGGANM
jgi:hypothetical protein